MEKKAVIYVRTSSEHQGEKSSPAEQEGDCRNLAAEHGLTVVNVYRDIERYRVKNRMVDPSGTRYDRPGLLAMLRDAAYGRFDIILAWREDRLYRGMRAMLMVLETIQEQKITIMLARETFDPKIAPLKAWVAQMELEGMKERMTMGVKARLRAGKALTGQDRYGYKRNGEVIEVVEDEARWVRQVFSWYINGMKLPEIRARLIEANAPQKGSSKPRKIRWSKSSIEAILKGAEEYYTGVKTHTRMGESFKIPRPPIIDLATYQRFKQVRRANLNHPACNLKRDYLIGGLLYCACNRKWGARSNSPRYRNARGEWAYYKKRTGVYYCPQRHKEHISTECPSSAGSKRADNIVWGKVCDAINKPEILLAQARKMVENLMINADSLDADKERIQSELDALTIERQWVITKARKGAISDSDMEYQLGAMSFQELSLKRELITIEYAVNIDLLNDWEAIVRDYLADLQAGLESLNTEPQSEEDAREIFEIKRQTVTTLVKRIEIDSNRDFHVEISLDLLGLLEKQSGGGFQNNHQIKSSATCCDRPSGCGLRV
jgi:site-specific DNA recombinase